MQFYASPEQIMRDRSEYARKGISRGRSAVVLSYDGGVLFVAENLTSLRKVSEIYDRIGFAAVGRYNEFENLRAAGVRMAGPRRFSDQRRGGTGGGVATPGARSPPRSRRPSAPSSPWKPSPTRSRSASARWARPRPTTSCTASRTTG